MEPKESEGSCTSHVADHMGPDESARIESIALSSLSQGGQNIDLDLFDKIGDANNNINTSPGGDCNTSDQQVSNNGDPKHDNIEDNQDDESKRLPDPDAIKMFVGQLPREWDEDDCRRLLEPHGPIYHLNLLRDKVTNRSKGCCFVTYYSRASAIQAQSALHDIYTIPGMKHAVQMKPADSESKNERKLFVGMIPRHVNEQQLIETFSQFGALEQATLLRHQETQQSRGCAFITFVHRQSAIKAIKQFNGKRIFPNSINPLVVKFADTNKDKEKRNALKSFSEPPVKKRRPSPGQAMSTSAGLEQSSLDNGTLAQLTPQYLRFPNQTRQLLLETGMSLPFGTPVSAAAASLVAPGSVNVVAPNTPIMSTMPSSSIDLASFTNSHLSPLANHLLLQQMISSSPSLVQNSSGSISSQVNTAAPSPFQYYQQAAMSYDLGLNKIAQNFNGFASPAFFSPNSLATPSPNSSSISSNASSPLDANPQGVLLSPTISGQYRPQQNSPNVQQPQIGLPFPFGGLTALNVAARATASPNSAVNSGNGQEKQAEGPEGANLFIYHLPQEYGDEDLKNLFQPFGNILSTKVFIDKNTNLSKCFGFVSYSGADEANSAITALNGMELKGKRLKVQVKKKKDAL